MGSAENGVGGSEILQYVDGSNQLELQEAPMDQYTMIPYIKIGIVLLIVIVATLIIFKILNKRAYLRRKAVSNEMDYMSKVKKRDASILAANKRLNILTNLIQHTPFAFDKNKYDYWKYNLTRANIRVPGGNRVMKPEEFNACVKSVQIIAALTALLITVLFNGVIGVIILLVDIVIGNTIPLIVIRQKVKEKDDEITANFTEFYLMIHYTLLSSAGTPISGLMKSYDKTTTSEEMHNFVATCLNYIENYGEFEATKHIAKQYREITQVSKLMRLIRQSNEGGDVRAELVGFRQELINDRKYAIKKETDKRVMKARLAFYILMPILFQAIVSAMGIYFKDLGMLKGFLGS